MRLMVSNAFSIQIDYLKVKLMNIIEYFIMALKSLFLSTLEQNYLLLKMIISDMLSDWRIY